ncbi:MAG: AAA family ATPase, partial [Candidatus Dormibacteria bacterium]
TIKNFMGRSSSPIDDDGLEKRSESDTERDMLFGDQRMWSVQGDSYFPCDKTEEALPAGQYIPVYSEHRGIYFVNKAVILDDLLILPDSMTTYVLNSIQHFWTKEEKFRQHGFLWKRGMLLYGPPGSGKTSCLQQMSSQIIAKKGISVYCTNPSVTAEALRILRRIEPDRPVVVLLEDIDAIIERFGEADLLALLDGELQIDNVVYIATTNYPEELDPRFIQRPSRFDEVVLIDMPNEKARRVYLLTKNPRLKINTEELDKWVEQTAGFSIAALKEVIVGVECLDKPMEDVINRIKDLLSRKVSSEDAERSIKANFGFGN